MRSITLKLSLAFLGVGLIGALLVAVFAGFGTRRAFDQFVVDRRDVDLVTTLEDHYAAAGGWSGTAEVLARGRPPGGDHGPDVLVVDANRRVVVGDARRPVGAVVTPADLGHSAPLTVDGAQIGWLVFEPGAGRRGPEGPEVNFLARITRAIVLSALGATGVALLLGVVLARTLTQPLRELTAATRDIARGALGRQVSVRSGDELGALALSFNQMSTDLERASTLRRQMTADIAHDLRTPLSVILGYTEALREGKLPADQEIFDTLHVEAQHLQHLIDDLRTLSLADAGELPLIRQSVPAGTLVERAAASVRAQAHERQVQLAVNAPADLPAVDVDPGRIAQVLGNLLSNALRYTPPNGTISLRAAPMDGAVALEVEDTGTGIAPEDLPHVFERFYRAEPSRSRSDGSSGLGLAIAKSIVEAHKGRIGVESTRGQGTRFTITLPQSQPQLQG